MAQVQNIILIQKVFHFFWCCGILRVQRTLNERVGADTRDERSENARLSGAFENPNSTDRFLTFSNEEKSAEKRKPQDG